MRIDYVLEGKATLETSTDLTNDVLKLVDSIANFKVNRGLREEIQSKRVKTLQQESKEKREARQEEQMKKKAEKQKEKEAKQANLTPEQQRKLEEKEHKRDLKRQNKKLVKIAKK